VSHFAKIEDGIVTEVIVAEQDVIDSGIFGDPSSWVQTSYNTKLSARRDPDTGDIVPGGDTMRGNFAGVGHIYDSVNDVFYPPKPFDSWVLNSATWHWIPPIPAPTDGKFYTWNEESISWDESIADFDPPPDNIPPEFSETRP
jgi:hypothetical protein